MPKKSLILDIESVVRVVSWFTEPFSIWKLQVVLSSYLAYLQYHLESITLFMIYIAHLLSYTISDFTYASEQLLRV